MLVCCIHVHYIKKVYSVTVIYVKVQLLYNALLCGAYQMLLSQGKMSMCVCTGQ